MANDKFVFKDVDYALSRQFDLGGSLGRSRRQDVRRLDSGIRVVHTRKVPERIWRFSLLKADRQDRQLVERFYFDIVKGQREKFNMVLTGEWREAVQCGATIGSVTIKSGQLINAVTLKCGQWITADFYHLNNVRFLDEVLIAGDNLDENADLEFEVVQEFKE